MANESTDRSIPDLVMQLTRQVSDLVRQEIQLAQAEMRQNAADIRRNITLLAAGGVVAFAGLLGLLATGVIALAQVVAPWVAGLIVGGGTLLIGLVLLLIGQAALGRARVAPVRTIKSIVSPQEAKS
jgi:hypothetical protein